MSTPLRIVATRGDHIESAHQISVAVARTDGRLVAQAGDPRLRTYWRSAAKPFQALAMVDDGAADRYGLGAEGLALACASHSSEPIHLEVTDRFLAKIGCTENDLACGPHTPLGSEVAARVAREGVTVTPRWSNCSGKHSGMLALAKHHGWETKGYELADHRVQRRILKDVTEWTGETPTFGVDGCAVVCFRLSLLGMARAYAALGEGASHGLMRLREAMLARPELVAGTGRSCTDVMQAAPGKVVVKLGADGVYSGALVGSGLGFSLKVEDGDMRVLGVALLAVLDQLATHLGWSERWNELTPRHGGYEIKNTRKAVTGRVFAEGELRFL